MFEKSAVDRSQRQRVAVVGGGVAGLVAAWRLAGHCAVDLYEKSGRLGGHIRPVALPSATGAPRWVDTAFLGYKPEVYPQLCQLLEELGITTRERSITGGLCFAARGLRFSRIDSETRAWPASIPLGRREQRAFVLLLARALKSGCAELPNVGLQDYLLSEGYPAEMIRYMIAPDVASIWGIQPEDALAMSVRGAVGSLLTVGKGVHTFSASTQPYLDALLARLHGVRVALDARVTGIRPVAGGVQLEMPQEAMRYDAVVLACPAEAAHGLLKGPACEPFAALGRIHHVSTVTVVHSDGRVPERFGTDFGHFNYLEDQFATVTWNLGELFGLTGPTPVLLTAGPPALVSEAAHLPRGVMDVAHHRHCVHTPQSIAAAESLKAVSGTHGIYLAGSYLGLAPIHEAAVASAQAAAAAVLDSGRQRDPLRAPA